MSRAATAPRRGRLRRADCAGPGIRRRRRGRGFSFEDGEGRAIEDEETLARIRELAIPPAWRDVEEINESIQERIGPQFSATNGRLTAKARRKIEREVIDLVGMSHLPPSG